MMKNNFQVLFRYIFSVFVLLLPFVTFGANDEDFYRRMLNADLNSLKQRAKDFIPAQPDSAIIYLSAVAARYSPEMSDEDKCICAGAMNNLGYLHFFHKHNVVMSYSYLIRSKDIAETLDDPSQMAYIALNIANVFCYIDDFESAISYYRKSINAGLESGEYGPVLTSLANAISYICSTHPPHSMKESLPELSKINRADFASQPMVDYTWSLVDGVDYWDKKNYAMAEKCFLASLDHIDTEYTPERFRHMSLALLAVLKSNTGNYQAAIDYLNLALKATDAPDIRAAIYGQLHHCFEKSGDRDKASYYLSRYVSLSDTLLRSGQIKALHNIEMQSSVDDLNLRLNRASTERRTLVIVICVILAAMAMMTGLGVWLWKSRSRLKRANEELYRQARARTAPPVMPDDIGETPGDDDADDAGRDLALRLRKIMETSDEIYRHDFSLDSLARLADAPSRKVSQAINSRGLNFSTFLQKYRVEEACRRLDDHEHYGRHTIEAISESLGFKSRSNFISVFKKFTGITPSEYQKISASRPADRENAN